MRNDRYTPHKYDLTMLAARVERHTGIAAEPVSSPAATSGGAEVVAKAEMLTYEQILDKIRPFNESSNISARELSSALAI